MVLNEKFDVPSVREQIKIIFNKSDWRAKTPYQKWCYLYGIGRTSLNILGFPVFRDDPSLYWFSYIFFVYMGIDIALVLYTIYYYLIRGDFNGFLPCTALLVGPLLCVSLKRVFLL